MGEAEGNGLGGRGAKFFHPDGMASAHHPCSQAPHRLQRTPPHPQSLRSPPSVEAPAEGEERDTGRKAPASASSQDHAAPSSCLPLSCNTSEGLPLVHLRVGWPCQQWEARPEQWAGQAAPLHPGGSRRLPQRGWASICPLRYSLCPDPEGRVGCAPVGALLPPLPGKEQGLAQSISPPPQSMVLIAAGLRPPSLPQGYSLFWGFPDSPIPQFTPSGFPRLTLPLPSPHPQPVHLAQVSFIIPAFNSNFTLDLELNQ